MFTIPNILSIARLGIALALPILAWYGENVLFFIFLILALLSDAVDGWIARKFSQISQIGTRLDSWGDLVLSFTVPLGVWLLWPALVRREILFIGILLASYTVPTLFALLKYRRIPSYHTTLAKFAGILTGITGMILLLEGPAWPFRITTLIVLIEAIDEITITAILPELTNNVSSLAHALRIIRHKS